MSSNLIDATSNPNFDPVAGKWREPKPPKKWVCIHEAGHAVASVIATPRVPGWRLREVVVHDKGGHCATHYGMEEHYPPNWRLITALAGNAAEKIISKRDDLMSVWDDLRKAERLAREIDDLNADDVLERYSDIAFRFVRVHRKQIIAVANVLRVAGRLTGPEVSLIVGGAS